MLRLAQRRKIPYYSATFRRRGFPRAEQLLLMGCFGMDCLLLTMRIRLIIAAAMVCLSSGCLLSPQVRGTSSESAPPVAPDPNRPEAPTTPGATSPTPAQLSAAM